VVIIAAGIADRIGLLRDGGGLVAANAWFGCPQPVAPAAQIEIGHLFAAAPYRLLRRGG
jgi:hypothetical protein